MRFGSVCSGIEAASVAWEPLGWEAAWFSEIEPFPSAVLAHHYPETPNLGDMTTLPARILAGEVEAPDVFCGGTPCQAFSVAGLRRSLDDARGNLSLTFCEIANAIDAVRRDRGELPAVVFWENVPGVLSTADNAFGCFLGALAGCDTAIVPSGRWTDAGVVAGPQRTVAWRILDAQYFGVAQRRRRVFVVASAREGFDPAAVLLEWEGVRWDTAPSREAGKIAPTIPSRSTAGGGLGTDFDCDGGVIQAYGGNRTSGSIDITPALLAQPGSGWKGDFESETFITHALRGEVINTTLDEGQTPVLAHSLRGEGFDASEDGTGRGTPLVPVHREIAPTLTSNYGKQPDSSDTSAGPMLVPVHVPEIAGTMKACKDSGGWSNSADHAAAGYMVPVAHAFDARQSAVLQYGDKTGPLDTDGHTIGVAVGITLHGTDGTQAVASFTDLSSSLRARIPSGVENSTTTAVMQPVAFTQNSRSEVREIGGDAQIVGALAADAGAQQQNYVMQPVAFQPRIARNGRGNMGDLVNALQAQSGQTGKGDAAPCVAVAVDTYNGTITGELAATISARNGIPDATGPRVMAAMQVRRLTPRECERLQGFPDDYTLIPWRGKQASECPDGPRYKALGNSWAVPVVRWIGRRIAAQIA